LPALRKRTTKKKIPAPRKDRLVGENVTSPARKQIKRGDWDPHLRVLKRRSHFL